MVFLYYYTCWMSGVVELGTILWGISHGYSLVETLMIALAYQIGNIALFLVSERIAKYQRYIFLGTALLFAFLFFLPDKSIVLLTLSCFLFAVFSTFLQITRQAVKGSIPRWRKRTCRVVGFFSSAILFLPFGTWVLVFFALSLCIISFFIPIFGYNNWFAKFKNGELGVPRICWSMVTHQAHYFAYTYVMFVLIFFYYNNPLIATIWFVGNWIPYTITEPLVKKWKLKNYYSIAIAAHIFNATILTLMFICTNSNQIIWAAILWILTGFGGGNVFCIRKALKPKVDYHDNIWMLSEQIGHMLGLVACLIMVILIGYNYTLLLGAAFALATIPIIVGTIKKKR